MTDVASTNGLSDSQTERLAVLVEELGEAAQMVGKILRHGYESCHPDDPTTTNRSRLERELADVLVAIDLLINRADISEEELRDRKRVKSHRIRDWLYHQ